jgi:hypothetical protein
MTLQRIELCQPITTRDGTLAKDSLTSNAVFEKNGNATSLVKRPGLRFESQVYSVSNPSFARANFIAPFLGYMLAGIGNKFYTITMGPITPTYLQDVIGDTYTWSWVKAPLDAAFIFHAGSAMYYYTNGAPSLTAITPPEALISGSLAPGFVFLNNRYYIAHTGNNLIYTSYIGDYTQWSSLATINFYQTSDNIVGICKHLNYIFVLGKISGQFFYDSGSGDNTTSPILPAQSYTMEVGCSNGNSIATTDNTVIWLGKSRSSGNSVYMLDGVSPIKVSNSAIDKILERSNLGEISSYVVKWGSHPCYVLTLYDTGVTLVFDMTTQQWHQWTQYTQLNNNDQSYGIGTAGTYTESYFRMGHAISTPSRTTTAYKVFGLDYYSGALYEFDVGIYQDNSQPIYFRSKTQITDNGTTKRKFYGRLEIVGDKIANGVMQVRHSGDDYNTYSTFRNIDLNASRSQIYLGGADRRRSWEFLSTSNVPLRIDGAEIDFRIGEMDQEQNMGRA